MQTVTTSKEEPSSWSYPGLWVGIFGLILVIIAVIILLFNWNSTGANSFFTDSWWIWILLAFGFILMIGGFIWYAFSGPDTTAEVKTTVTSAPIPPPVMTQNSSYPYGTLINQIPLVPEQYRAPDGTIYRRENGINKSPDSYNLVALDVPVQSQYVAAATPVTTQYVTTAPTTIPATTQYVTATHTPVTTTQYVTTAPSTSYIPMAPTQTTPVTLSF